MESVFFSSTPIKSPEAEALEGLVENLNLQQVNIENFLPDNIKLTQLESQSIDWLPNERQLLEQGQILTLFDDKLGRQMYLMNSEQILYELTLKQDEPDRAPLLLYTSLFYVILAGLLLVWVWPLWRDLAKIKRAISKIEPGGVLAEVELNKRSLILPIAQTFNQLSRQVSQLMSTQRELTGAVAHEFRTPLSRLKFALAVKPRPGTEPWNDMNADVNELEKLVQEMLNFTSMEAHQPEMNMSEIPLYALSNQLVSNLTEAQKNNREIVVSGQQELAVIADEHYLARAIENLILNAIRYSHDAVDIKISKKEQFIRLDVEDDGPGIPAHLSEKIFEPFFRPDEGRDRTRGGAGLGLAIVKRIMQWHHGQCFATQSAKGGAKFRLRFVSNIKKN